MTVDEAIQALDEAIDGYVTSCKGSPRHKKVNIVRAREALIKAVRDETVTKFAESLRESLLKT